MLAILGDESIGALESLQIVNLEWLSKMRYFMTANTNIYSHREEVSLKQNYGSFPSNVRPMTEHEKRRLSVALFDVEDATVTSPLVSGEEVHFLDCDDLEAEESSDIDEQAVDELPDTPMFRDFAANAEIQKNRFRQRFY